MRPFLTKAEAAARGADVDGPLNRRIEAMCRERGEEIFYIDTGDPAMLRAWLRRHPDIEGDWIAERLAMLEAGAFAGRSGGRAESQLDSQTRAPEMANRLR